MAAAGWTEQGMIETLSVCVRLVLGPIFDEPSCLRPSAPPHVRPPGAPPGHTVLASPAPSTDCCPPRLPGAPMRPSLNWSDLRWGRSSPCPHAPPRVTLPLFLGPIFCPLAPPLDGSGTEGGRSRVLSGDRTPPLRIQPRLFPAESSDPSDHRIEQRLVDDPLSPPRISPCWAATPPKDGRNKSFFRSSERGEWWRSLFGRGGP